MNDTRIEELEAFARESGLTLPYPPDLIVWFEDRGMIVDLATGIIFATVSVATMPNAKAVAYLLTEAQGDTAF